MHVFCQIVAPQLKFNKVSVGRGYISIFGYFHLSISIYSTQKTKTLILFLFQKLQTWDTNASCFEKVVDTAEIFHTVGNFGRHLLVSQIWLKLKSTHMFILALQYRVRQIYGNAHFDLFLE